MTSVTLAVDNETREGMLAFPWVNWSAVATEEVSEEIEKREAFEKFNALVAKSKLTEKDAEALAEKVKKSMHSRLKKEGLV